MRQGHRRFSKFSSTVIQLCYLLKAFTEGRRVKDKVVLLLGTVPQIIGLAIASRSRTSATAGRSTSPSFINKAYCIISRPAFDVAIENRDGKFFCRRGTDDAMGRSRGV